MTVTAVPPFPEANASEAHSAANGGLRDALRAHAEQQLVARLLSGDRDGALELYRRLQPVVDRTLRRILGRRGSDHDDLVQLSFEQIVRTLREGRFSYACPLTAWASTLTARVALNELRRRYRRRRYFSDADVDVDETAATLQDWQHEATQRERLEEVRRELGRLEPGRARVVYLHDVEGYRLADIAVLLGISLTAVQSRLLRGRQQLVSRCHALESDAAPNTVPNTLGRGES